MDEIFIKNLRKKINVQKTNVLIYGRENKNQNTDKATRKPNSTTSKLICISGEHHQQ